MSCSPQTPSPSAAAAAAADVKTVGFCSDGRSSGLMALPDNAAGFLHGKQKIMNRQAVTHLTIWLLTSESVQLPLLQRR